MAFEADREVRRERHNPLNKKLREEPPMKIAQKGPIKHWIPLRYKLKAKYFYRNWRGTLWVAAVWVGCLAAVPYLRKWTRDIEEDEPHSMLEYLVTQQFVGKVDEKQAKARIDFDKQYERLHQDVSPNRFKEIKKELFKTQTRMTDEEVRATK